MSAASEESVSSFEIIRSGRHFFKSDEDWKRVEQLVDFKVAEAA